jgi:hypothetical protein
MAEHHGHESQGPTEAELRESIAAGYEKEDVSLSVLLRWGFGLAIFLVATSAAALILFVILQKPPFGPPALGETFLRNNNQPIVPPPGTPIVQDNPSGDPRPDNNPRRGIDNIREFRRDEEIRMNEYATQDGNIHIPIDRALELSVPEVQVQKTGETPTGVTPTPEMKLHPSTSEPSTGAGSGAAPPPAAGQ